MNMITKEEDLTKIYSERLLKENTDVLSERKVETVRGNYQSRKTRSNLIENLEIVIGGYPWVVVWAYTEKSKDEAREIFLISWLFY